MYKNRLTPLCRRVEIKDVASEKSILKKKYEGGGEKETKIIKKMFCWQNLCI